MSLFDFILPRIPVKPLHPDELGETLSYHKRTHPERLPYFEGGIGATKEWRDGKWKEKN